ncbi:MAG TPA: hypothetical protein VFA65_05495 [Bryobacteraceae bacterium]|nr:hypothetical protein [Bryobacteraceae bacterium]
MNDDRFGDFVSAVALAIGGPILAVFVFAKAVDALFSAVANNALVLLSLGGIAVAVSLFILWYKRPRLIADDAPPKEEPRFELPLETRYRGMYVVAPPGRGKTTALKTQIHRDLELVCAGEASIVVMNSDRDLIDDIANLRMFAEELRGKLIVVEPSIEHPLALNIFAMGRQRSSSYSQDEQETLSNATTDLIQYIFDGLNESPMTPKQEALFLPCVRALLSIPDATLASLRDLLISKKDYMAEKLQYLDPLTRQFFEHQFYDTNFSATRQELGWRLNNLLYRGAFEKMLCAAECRLDLFAELNSAKVILIHTNKRLLAEKQCEMFGRLFIAMVLRAAEERAIQQRQERMPTFFYIDECQDYVANDAKIRKIINHCRKMNVATVLANQKLSDLSEPVQKVLLDAGIKLINVSAEAPTFAARLGVPAEQLNQPTGRFIAHVEGTEPVLLNIINTMDDLPTMTPAQREEIEREMRARYCVRTRTPEEPLVNFTPRPEDMEPWRLRPSSPVPNQERNDARVATPSLDADPTKPSATW